MRRRHAPLCRRWPRRLWRTRRPMWWTPPHSACSPLALSVSSTRSSCRSAQLSRPRSCRSRMLRGLRGWRRGRGRKEREGRSCPRLPPRILPRWEPFALGSLDSIFHEPFVSGNPVPCLGVASTVDTCSCVSLVLRFLVP